MLDQFKQHIKKIVPSGSKLLVAVSGGVDSIVLCELLKKKEIKKNLKIKTKGI